MTFNPFTAGDIGFASSDIFVVETLDDVVEWLNRGATHLHATTRRDYLYAVKRIGKRLKRPLKSIPANLPAILDQFPDREYTKADLSCICEGSVPELQKLPFKPWQTEALMLRCTPRSAVSRKQALQSLSDLPTADLRVQ